jgi:uncharacterized protein with GYD domain
LTGTIAFGPVPNDHDQESTMSIYMVRAKYTPEAMKGMVARPGDREGPARVLFEAAGLKLQHMWYSGQGEIVCIAEGNAVNGATVAMVVMASGGLCDASMEELLTTKQQVEAMKAAGEMAAKYRAPGS